MTAKKSSGDARRCLMAAAFLMCTAMMPGRAAEPAEPMTVHVDQASLIKLPDKVGVVVVGNPFIADAAVQPGGIMVVTGKGYGATNIIALDRAGNVLMEKVVQVKGPRESVTVVYRGVERETYSCLPKCERRITLGDAPTFFDANLVQAGKRNGLAGGGAAPPAN